MRVLEVNNTVIDLNAQDVPFVPGYTVVALNGSSEQRVLQESDNSDGSSPTTLATLEAAGTAGAVKQVTLNKQYILTSAASDPISLLGN